MSVATTAVKERPILFSGPMVRAILEGRKTQTRRVVSRANSSTMPPWNWLEFDDAKVPDSAPPTFADNGYLHVATKPNPNDPPRLQTPNDWLRNRVYPTWEPGERLWVREAWIVGYEWQNGRLCTENEDGNELPKRVWYHADGDLDFWCDKHGDLGLVHWRPSIHMPRWASRLTLEITRVRVERLQDISAEDAVAEGVTAGDAVWSGSARNAFRESWDSINAKRGLPWATNPWVWVIDFRRIEP